MSTNVLLLLNVGRPSKKTGEQKLTREQSATKENTIFNNALPPVLQTAQDSY